jgi:glycosyltransferase involved in cell wall biosynthesis
MKILALERSGLFYGSAINLKNWIEKYTTDNDCEIDVLLGENGEINSELLAVGAKLLDLQLPTSLNTYGKKNIVGLSFLTNGIRLIAYNIYCICKCKKKYDVVVVNNYRSTVYYMLFLFFIKFTTKSKIIVRLQISQMPLKILGDLAVWLADEVIVHGTRGYCEREFGEKIAGNPKITCIPNPVNNDKFRYSAANRNLLREEFKIPMNATVFLSVCYIEPRKGVLQLVNTFNNANLPNTFLVHVGDQGTHHKYLSQVKNAANKNTIFLGKRNDVEKLYSIADAFVLFSEYEGMPYVILEAMSSGLPIISTFAGSNEEVVTADVGTLINYDDVGMLEKLLTEFEAHAESYKLKGLLARERVTALYSEEQYFESLRKIY